MQKIELYSPKIEYSSEIMAFREEMLEAGSDFAGCGGLCRCESCEDWLEELSRLESEQACPSGYAPSSTFLAVREGRVVGIIELRHRIDTPVLSSWGGHIGFSVRPSERNKGYAKEMLGRLIEICGTRGYERLLITCNAKNTASERVIMANGGVFDSEIAVDGQKIKRFWITLDA